MTAPGKEPESATHQVFISYASENINSTTSDRQVADQICTALESQGIRCWIAPRDILPGDEWMEAIIDAVDQTKIIVLVFSANTEKSQWVKDEIKLALEEKRTIIPFRIQDVYPKRALRLLKVRCQWMDAFTPPLEKHIESLVKIVSRHLGLESPDMPGDVKKVIPIAHKVEKNKNGFWEAYYQDGIVMVYVPPGEFMMGQTDEEKKWLIDQIGEKDYNKYYTNETPLHKVYLDGYWIGKYEVTFAQYDRYCNDTKKEKPGDEGWGRENRPVINVSWTEAAAYCQWLSKKTGLQFNLPTEAQWEKSARGNDRRKYPWGNHEPYYNGKWNANYRAYDSWEKRGEDGFPYTAPVGSYPLGSSPYGLLDMAGNVWEWCSDRYDRDYYKNLTQENNNKIIKNPAGPDSGSYRVFRGGGWFGSARYLRCAYRSGGPSFRGVDLGFRLRQDI